jgi:transposase
MWTPTTRQKHSRTVTRYQTDLTDKEWRVIEPHLPKPCATGRPREWPMREIVNGIFYVMRAGCPWRLVPSDLPPWETIYRWFAAPLCPLPAHLVQRSRGKTRQTRPLKWKPPWGHRQKWTGA